MKKKIIIGAFCTLILVTAIGFLAAAINSYYAEMEHNGDQFAGLSAVLTAFIGGFVVLYELDLFYTVYYLFLKPKTTAKTLLNILSNLSFALTFVCASYAFEVHELVPIVLFLLYILFRFTYGFISSMESTAEA